PARSLPGGGAASTLTASFAYSSSRQTSPLPCWQSATYLLLISSVVMVSPPFVADIDLRDTKLTPRRFSAMPSHERGQGRVASCRGSSRERSGGPDQCRDR